MIDSILLDKRRVLPCSVLLEGEYGIVGLFVGVPVKLGREGVRQIIPLSLNADELAALRKSAGAVSDLVEAMKRLAAEGAANA
jgi:malate dehydrogenase